MQHAGRLQKLNKTKAATAVVQMHIEIQLRVDVHKSKYQVMVRTCMR